MVSQEYVDAMHKTQEEYLLARQEIEATYIKQMMSMWVLVFMALIAGAYIGCTWASWQLDKVAARVTALEARP